MDRVVWHCRKDAPRRACGLLGGVADPRGKFVERAYPCENVDPDPRRRYTVSPRDLWNAWRRLEDRDFLALLALYHSHPQGPDGPAAEDADRPWPHLSYVIVSLEKGTHVSSWVWDPGEGRFHSEQVVVV
jgi:proteasome lid subunit RPN8/RPN11